MFMSFFFKILFFSFLLFLLLTNFVILSVDVESESMSRSIERGDRIFASPILYGMDIDLFSNKITGFEKPQRGDLVLVRPPYYKNLDFPFNVFDTMLKFITLQKISLNTDATGKRIDSLFVKRIIGLPGDTVKVSNFTAYVKNRKAEDFLKETEIIPVKYMINIDEKYFVKGWKDGFPYSGNSDEVQLGENEYFVLGDNRMNSNDSISWGAINYSNIVAKVFFRYWPFDRFGSL